MPDLKDTKNSPNALIAAALGGGAIGGAAGYFLADAFWDLPTRVQRLITGVTGLIIGGAGGALVANSLKELSDTASRLYRMQPLDRAFRGHTHPDGNSLTNTLGNATGLARWTSPINTDGNIAWNAVIGGGAANAGSQFAAGRVLLRIQNIQDLHRLRLQLADIPNANVGKNALAKGMLSTKDLKRVLSILKRHNISSPEAMKVLNQADVKINEGGVFVRRGVTKGKRWLGRGIGALSNLIAMGLINSASGFNDDFNAESAQLAQYLAKD